MAECVFRGANQNSKFEKQQKPTKKKRKMREKNIKINFL